MLKSIFTLLFLNISTFIFCQENPAFRCGTSDNQIIDEKLLLKMKNLGKNPNLRMADLPKLECLIAVAVEYDIYLHYEKNQNLIKEKVYRYFDKVAEVFEDEMNIKLIVSHLEIVDTPREDTLKKLKPKTPYHIAHLFRLGDAMPNFAAGIAFISKTSDGQYSLYCISGNFVEDAIVTKTMAHEIGHCFDSPHTQSCAWPNGPIDYCSRPEGNCDENFTYSVIGSIMGYCLNSVFSFHPLCREIIRSRADEILQPILTTPTKPIIENLVQNSISTEPALTWKYNLKTRNYRIQISDNQLFTKTLIDSTINFNYFQAYSLENEKTYFWRIKALNHKGESDWSEIARFTSKNSISLSFPVVKGTYLDNEQIQNVKLELYDVKGATEYEFRLTDFYNYYEYGFTKTRLNNNVTFKIKSPIFSFNQLQRNDFYSDSFYWQARVIRNGVTSNWTPIQTFVRFLNSSHIFPKQSTRLSTTFPIIWDSKIAPINREYTLQVAEDDEFKKIFFEKNRTLNTMGSASIGTSMGFEVVENLKPNTVYYYRYKEKNGIDKWQVSYFKTTGENTKWKFINEVNQPFSGSNQYFTQSNDSSKILFINTSGIYQTDGVNWGKPLNAFTTKGLVYPSIFTNISTDTKNNIYYNDSRSGLVKYDGQSITKLTSLPPLTGKQMGSFITDNKGDLYATVGTDSSYFDVFKLSDGKWQSIPRISSTKNYVPKFYVDKNNTLWATVTDTGIFKFNGKTWENIRPNMKNYIFGSFTTDGNDNIWWVENYMIYRKSPDNKIKTYSYPADLPSQSFKYMIADRKGTMWVLSEINTKAVLLKLQNEKWARIDTEYDLPLPLRFLSDYSGMAVDRQNRLWLFTNNFGAFIYDDSGQIKSQKINAEKITDKKVSTKSFKIIANASSGLPLSYKIISGNAKIQKDSIVLSGQLGKIVVQVSQSGNEIYEPAPNVELSFEVKAKDNQTISFNKIDQKTFGDGPFTLNATSSSGLEIGYQIISGPATLNKNIVTLTGTGKVTIRANQVGNDDFFAANTINQEFCVIPAKPQIATDLSNSWQLKVNTDKNIQWYFEGKKVLNGNQSTLIATENGNYQVEILNSDNSCPSNISNIFQLLVLANNEKIDKQFNIYPNPTNENIVIDSKYLSNLKEIKIFDMKGSLIYSTNEIELPYHIKIQNEWKGNIIIELITNDNIISKKVFLH